jgi:hypothetical protein
MASIIYFLCAIACLFCTFLLMQAYWRSRYALLLWSALCFSGLSLNNLLLVFDKIVFPDIDFSVWRTLVALVSMAILLFGLVWSTEE